MVMKSSKSLMMALLVLICTSFSATCGNSVKQTDVPESPVKSCDFNFSLMSAKANYKCVGSNSYDVPLFYTIEASLQWPTKIGNNDIRILQDSILEKMFDKPKPTVDASLTNFIAHPDLYGDKCRLVKIDSVPDASEDNKVLSSSVKSNIIYVSDRFASFRFFFFEYSGGAHGNYGSNFLNYDVQNNRVLSLKDIFIPGSDAKVIDAIKQGLCNKFNVDSVAQLPEELSLDQLYITNIFYLSENTINFVYQPYEIGPYAMGEIEVPVNAYEFDDILTPLAKKLLKQ
jgi:hypothetical protein